MHGIDDYTHTGRIECKYKQGNQIIVASIILKHSNDLIVYMIT